MHHHNSLALTILIVAVASACSSVPRLEGGGLSEAATISVTDFEIGDCFDDPIAGEVMDVSGLPCNIAHDNEVYAVFDHDQPDQSWPGQQALDDYSYEACVDRFAGYVGADYLDSRLEVSFFTPLQDGWSNGDHEIVCFLYEIDFAKLDTAMRGSGE